MTSFNLAVFAAGKKAYGATYYGVTNHWNPVKDKAWATITRNDDLPVANRLYAEMWVQYQNKDNFYWEAPLRSLKYNAEKEEVIRWRYSLMAIRVRLEATAEGCDDYVLNATARTK